MIKTKVELITGEVVWLVSHRSRPVPTEQLPLVDASEALTT